MALAAVTSAMTSAVRAGGAPDLIAGLTGNESTGGSGGNGVVVAIVTLAILLTAAGYIASLFLHPWRNCRACKGAGRRRGAIYSYAQRPCAKCKGSGRQVRFGNRFRDVSTN